MCQHLRTVVYFVSMMMLFSGGCASTKQASKDEASLSPESTEPMVVSSADQLSEAETAADSEEETHFMVVNRNWDQANAHYQHAGVEHPSLYMQDPFENQGSEDETGNTWDWDSFFSAAASPFIFIGNIALVPIEAVFNPPWKNQVSRDDTPVQTEVYELSGEPSGMAAKNQWKMPFEKKSPTDMDSESEDK